jgi:hypothetical protein
MIPHHETAGNTWIEARPALLGHVGSFDRSVGGRIFQNLDRDSEPNKNRSGQEGGRQLRLPVIVNFTEEAQQSYCNGQKPTDDPK